MRKRREGKWKMNFITVYAFLNQWRSRMAVTLEKEKFSILTFSKIHTGNNNHAAQFLMYIKDKPACHISLAHFMQLPIINRPEHFVFSIEPVFQTLEDNRKDRKHIEDDFRKLYEMFQKEISLLFQKKLKEYRLHYVMKDSNVYKEELKNLKTYMDM